MRNDKQKPTESAVAQVPVLDADEKYQDAVLSINNTKNIVFVETDAARLIHDQMVNEFGGLPGIRDIGALESALARPRNLIAYGKKNVNLGHLAVALCCGIAQNHPFVDANKRSAFLLMYSFLRVNGVLLQAEDKEVVEVMVNVAGRKLDEKRLYAWIRAHSHHADFF